jgi:hypothetical protein
MLVEVEWLRKIGVEVGEDNGKAGEGRKGRNKGK